MPAPRRVPDPDPLYTPTQLADLWGCSRSYLYLLLRDGRLPSVQIGRARRIRASVADAYLDAHTLYASPAEARADHELQAAARRLVAVTRERQGLPPTLDGAAVLDRLAAILDAEPEAS